MLKLWWEARSRRPLKVVLGAAETSFAGWLSTDREVLDILSPDQWRRIFKAGSIDRLLAEHVFEHLSEEECRSVFRECWRYLKPGGLLRVAVPDGYRTDPDYLAHVSPPSDGHKVLFTVDTLVGLLEGAGFRTIPLEYFDKGGQFRSSPWSEEDGFVQRSMRFDKRESFKQGDVCYTSLIVDAWKD